MKKVLRFCRREKLLCISAALALASMFAVPPSAAYAAYIDLRVLGLLWCLMAVVAGFRACGTFAWMTARLLSAARGNGRALAVVLVLLPFFTAMAVTNDVALIAFVPFTLVLLKRAGQARAAIPIVVLQTLAANLGSMATPVGNPQNLYLYSFYGLDAGGFFALLLPPVLLSLICLTAAALPVLPRAVPTPALAPAPRPAARLLALYGGLFGLCLLSVFGLLPWWVLTGLIFIALLGFDRALLRAPDYGLLATFVCFFIFSGNLGQIAWVRTLLQALLFRSTLITAALASQVISNVPAAVLLSGFTANWQGLLLGVNIGGLGTPVASLASLISLKFYLREPGAQPLRYLAAFTGANLIGLLLLLGFALCL